MGESSGSAPGWARVIGIRLTAFVRKHEDRRDVIRDEMNPELRGDLAREENLLSQPASNARSRTRSDSAVTIRPSWFGAYIKNDGKRCLRPAPGVFAAPATPL